jgi:nicotinamidase-related amidase
MKPLLLVADFINDIVHPDGKLVHYAQRVIENNTIKHANQAIAWAREENIPIAHVKVGFSKSYVECPKNSPAFGSAEENQALLLDSWGTEFHKDIDVQPQDIIITKHRINAFYGTNLEPILKAQNIDTLIICGVATNYVVEHTARDAHDRDYNVIVLADACEASSQEEHNATLKSLSILASVSITAKFQKNLTL